MCKVDFSNAFNSVRRDVFMKQVLSNFPEIFPFVHQCYRRSSLLSLDSAEGAQQGDPLGPLLFCLAIMPLTKQLSSNLNLWYLDDGFLAGDPVSVMSDLSSIVSSSSELGLAVNPSKCEILALSCSAEESHSLYSACDSIASGISIMTHASAQLLGSAIFPDGLTSVLEDKNKKLCRLLERLKLLDRHDALFLLKNCIAIPRLLYTLRTQRCLPHPLLAAYDSSLRRGLESILNTKTEDASWLQATLPVSSGGLGVRRATDLAEPAFLSSAFSVQDAVSRILESEDVDSNLLGSIPLPESVPEPRSSQKAWDTLFCKRRQSDLFELATEPRQKCRLLASAAASSGAWLNALPSSALCLKLDDEQLRTAAALRIGAPICQPHRCRFCNAAVDANASHGLSCRYSVGRHPRHHAVNDIIKRALGSAGIPSIMEPPGLSRSDGKRPDGMTLIPWSRGCALVWDFTCADTLANSNISATATTAGAAAEGALRKKHEKYLHLAEDFTVVAVAMETLGPWASESLAFIKDLGRRIAKISGEPRSTAFLLQRISIAVQKANCSCVLGTLPTRRELEGMFYLA